MRVAVLSDIHGNLPALQAVTDHIQRWQPDHTIVNGDIVNRGPCSLDCLTFVQAQAHANDWQLLRGNHEDFVLSCGNPDSPRSGPNYEVIQFAHWAYLQLGNHVNSLAGLPDRWGWEAPDGSEIRVTHASMQNNRDGIFAKTPDDYLRTQIAPAPAVFVTAHTHEPLLRQLDETLVVNIGSVGSPFDENSRASYGQFVWDGQRGWQAKIVRVAYDRQQTERDYVQSGFLAEAGPLAQLMLVEQRRARGLIYRWLTRYQDLVLASQMSMAESVRLVLGDEDLRPFIGPPGWTI
jgi:predicted phosphodiesterase